MLVIEEVNSERDSPRLYQTGIVKPGAGWHPTVCPFLMGSKGFPEGWACWQWWAHPPIWGFINKGLALKADNKLIKKGSEASQTMLLNEDQWGEQARRRQWSRCVLVRAAPKPCFSTPGGLNKSSSVRSIQNQ